MPPGTRVRRRKSRYRLSRIHRRNHGYGRNCPVLSAERIPVLLTDARGHGKARAADVIRRAEPEDAASRLKWLVKKTRGNSRMILHRLSMMRATALMAAGKDASR